MNDVAEHSDSEFCFPKKKKKKGKARWSYDKMLIDWVRSGRTGKYLALGHGARSVLRDLGPNIYPSGPPTQSISTYDDPSDDDDAFINLIHNTTTKTILHLITKC